MFHLKRYNTVAMIWLLEAQASVGYGFTGRILQADFKVKADAPILKAFCTQGNKICLLCLTDEDELTSSIREVCLVGAEVTRQ